MDNGVEKVKPVANTISIREVYEKGSQLKRPEYRIAYYMIYLTGGRVSEVTQLRVRDIEYVHDRDNRLIAIFSLITEKRKDHPTRMIPVIYYDPTLPDDCENNYEYENKMIRSIIAFTKPMLIEEKIFRIPKYNKLTNYFRRNIVLKVDGIFKGKVVKGLIYKMHPHYLRHCRITHMRKLYGFDAIDLKQFAGWTSTKMTDIYLHLGYKNLVEKMVKYG